MTTHLFIRKAHRYLGLSIGIQFIAWTVSGLYFSWNNIDDVHGDQFRKTPSFVSSDVNVVAPSVAIQNLKAKEKVDSIHSILLTSLLNKPVYQINYFSGHSGEGLHLHTHKALADATTGAVRAPINKEEAISIARQHVSKGTVTASEYLQQTDGHHEYRGKVLPAWTVTFSDPDFTMYISAELGTFQSIRHDQWRAFDFLWMFHTMDYEARDDFNNWLLKIFSVLGLITVTSGFALYFLSSRTLKRFIK